MGFDFGVELQFEGANSAVGFGRCNDEAGTEITVAESGAGQLSGGGEIKDFNGEG